LVVEVSTNASPDYTKGWLIALGDVSDGTQAPMAPDFYSAVLDGKTYQDGKQDDVLFTGHSLGGALAGYPSPPTKPPPARF
jgi:hypothetical protein